LLTTPFYELTCVDISKISLLFDYSPFKIISFLLKPAALLLDDTPPIYP
jgi:hypothetical protein